MSAKNLLLGEVDDPIYSNPKDKGYLTADEVAMDKYTEQEPNDIISRKVDIPRRERHASPSLDMPVRNADGEKTAWKPQRTVDKETARRAGERAARLASTVKEWLESNPEVAREAEAAAKAKQRPVHTYGEMWDAYKRASAEHEHEKGELEKKRRRDLVLAGLADGLGAFHEAYSYARGIEPMKGLGEATKKVAEAYDKRRLLTDKDYKERMDEILNHLRMERQMELDASTQWWREQNLEETRRWHDMNKQGKEDAANKKAETEEKKIEATKEANAKKAEQKDRELDIKQEANDIKKGQGGKSKSSSAKSGTKKGRKKKTLPKKKARDNAASQRQTGSGNTAPVIKKKK